MNILIVCLTMADVKSTRVYRSALRDESARRTRRAIVAAASELFVTRGFAATSLAQVARAAGVARPTVFAAFGSKTALLRQVLDEALAGDDEPVPVRERPWFQPVWRASSHESALDAYADVCVLIGHRAAGIFEAVRRAADAASDAAEVWASLQQNRRAGARMVIDHLVHIRPLSRGRQIEEAVDRLWFFNDPAHYNALVRDCNWTEDAFRDWLSSQMRHAILGGP